MSAFTIHVRIAGILKCAFDAKVLPTSRVKDLVSGICQKFQFLTASQVTIVFAGKSVDDHSMTMKEIGMKVESANTVFAIISGKGESLGLDLSGGSTKRDEWVQEALRRSLTRKDGKPERHMVGSWIEMKVTAKNSFLKGEWILGKVLKDNGDSYDISIFEHAKFMFKSAEITCKSENVRNPRPDALSVVQRKERESILATSASKRSAYGLNNFAVLPNDSVRSERSGIYETTTAPAVTSPIVQVKQHSRSPSPNIGGAEQIGDRDRPAHFRGRSRADNRRKSSLQVKKQKRSRSGSPAGRRANGRFSSRSSKSGGSFQSRSSMSLLRPKGTPSNRSWTPELLPTRVPSTRRPASTPILQGVDSSGTTPTFRSRGQGRTAPPRRHSAMIFRSKGGNHNRTGTNSTNVSTLSAQDAWEEASSKKTTKRKGRRGDKSRQSRTTTLELRSFSSRANTPIQSRSSKRPRKGRRKGRARDDSSNFSSMSSLFTPISAKRRHSAGPTLSSSLKRLHGNFDRQRSIEDMSTTRSSVVRRLDLLGDDAEISSPVQHISGGSLAIQPRPTESASLDLMHPNVSGASLDVIAPRPTESSSIIRMGHKNRPSESVTSQPQTQIGLNEIKQEEITLPGDEALPPLPAFGKQSSIISLAEFGNKTNVRELAKTYKKPTREIKAYVKLFKAEVDTENNGAVSKKELLTWMNKSNLEVSEKMLDKYLSTLKIGPDGEIDLENFIHILCVPESAPTLKQDSKGKKDDGAG